MELEITSPALGALIEKTLQNLKAEHSSFDLIEYLGFLTTQQVGGGYFEQLKPISTMPSKTPPDWDFGDLIPAALKNVGIYDMATGDARRRQGHLRHSWPPLRLGHLLLPQGSVRRRRPAARQDLGRVQGGRAEAAQRRRRRLQLHRRQRLLAGGGRLVHALHHHRRRANDAAARRRRISSRRSTHRKASAPCRC